MSQSAKNILTAGQTLSGNKTYTLKEQLGSGLTANVWLAHDAAGDPVALKCLRDDASEVSIEHFWHESDILAELRGAGAGMYVPQFLDSARTGIAPFLALEFVAQPPYQPLDERAEKEGIIPEVEILEIAVQALTLLNLLHTKVQRSYTDMQLKNFWWDAAAKRLKVMDWNHVSPRKEEIDEIKNIADEGLRRRRELQLANWGANDFQGLVQADLARFASYLYQLTTAFPVSSQGATLRELREKAGENWVRLSPGLRRILQRALAVHPTDRYADSAAFLQDCNSLLKLWQISDSDEAAKLLESIQDGLRELEKTPPQPEAPALNTVVEQYQTQLAVLSALEEAGKIELDRRAHAAVREALNKWLQNHTPRWAEGQRMYEIKQYREAQARWQAEALRLGETFAYRWLSWLRALIASPNQFDDAQRARVEAFLNELESGNFSNATAFDLTGFENTVLQLFKQEAQHWLNIQAARRLDAASPEAMQQAAQSLDNAAAWLNTLQNSEADYAGRLQQDWGDLAAEAKLLREQSQRQQTHDNTLNQLQTALKDNFELGLKQLTSFLRDAPANSRIRVFALNQFEQMRAASPERALELAKIIEEHAYLSTEQRIKLQHAKSAIIKGLELNAEQRQQTEQAEKQRQLEQERRERTASERQARIDKLIDETQSAICGDRAFADLRISIQELASLLDADSRTTEKYQNLQGKLEQQFEQDLQKDELWRAEIYINALRTLNIPVEPYEVRLKQSKEAVNQKEQAFESIERAAKELPAALNAVKTPTESEIESARQKIEQIKQSLEGNPQATHEKLRCTQALAFLGRLQALIMPIAQRIAKTLDELETFDKTYGKGKTAALPQDAFRKLARLSKDVERLETFYQNYITELGLFSEHPLEQFENLKRRFDALTPDFFGRLDSATQAAWDISSTEPAHPETSPEQSGYWWQNAKTWQKWLAAGIAGLTTLLLIVLIAWGASSILTQPTPTPDPLAIAATSTPTPQPAATATSETAAPTDSPAAPTDSPPPTLEPTPSPAPTDTPTSTPTPTLPPLEFTFVEIPNQVVRVVLVTEAPAAGVTPSPTATASATPTPTPTEEAASAQPAAQATPTPIDSTPPETWVDLPGFQLKAPWQLVLGDGNASTEFSAKIEGSEQPLTLQVFVDREPQRGMVVDLTPDNKEDGLIWQPDPDGAPLSADDYTITINGSKVNTASKKSIIVVREFEITYDCRKTNLIEPSPSFTCDDKTNKFVLAFLATNKKDEDSNYCNLLLLRVPGKRQLYSGDYGRNIWAFDNKFGHATASSKVCKDFPIAPVWGAGMPPTTTPTAP